MAGRKPPDGTGKPDDDEALFVRTMKDVRRLDRRSERIVPKPVAAAKTPGAKAPGARRPDRGQRPEETAPPKAGLSKDKAPRPAPARPVTVVRNRPSRAALDGLDRRNAERFRRGEIAIEGRIDLHGLTQERAHDALLRYLRRAHAAGKRCIIVITGKGGPRMPRGGAADAGQTGERFIIPDRRGILHGLVPRWLAERDFAHYVVAFHPAQPRHGGDGALYVYLRRHRPDDGRDGRG